MASKGSGIRVVVFDEHDKIHGIISKAVIESIESFYHLSSCVSYIQQNARDDRATVIITTSVEDSVLQTFETLEPVEAILILSPAGKDVYACPSKVIGIYPEFENLLRALFETLDKIEFQLDANSILFHHQKDGNENPDFYFYYLWKMYNPNQITTKKSLIDQSRIIFRYENQLRAPMHDFYVSYKSSEVLFWLDKYKHPYPYSLLVLNALRTHDQQILSLIRFFILDLTKQMKPLPKGASYNQVYFGAKLPIKIVDRLEHQTSKDIISFQCFLPVTRSRSNAVAAATQPTRRRKLGNVLFKIDASHALCAHMGDVILLDMATPFHITRVTRNTGSGGVQQLVTIVTLVALDKANKDYIFGQFIQNQKKAGRTIYDFIQQTIPIVRAENSPEKKTKTKFSASQNAIPLYVVTVSKNDQHSLSLCNDETEADDLIARGNWAQAVDALARVEDPNVRVLNKEGCLLRERLQDLPAALECHQQALIKATDRGKAETNIYLGIVHHDMKQYDEAFRCYHEALQWYEKEKPRDPAMIARCLVGLGNTHWANGQLDDALDCAERALAIREREVKPRNDFDVAACLGNMGNILHDQGDIERALACAKRAVDILSTCGKGDPRLGAALNNLGAMYQACGDYGKSREYFERALKSLPNENHPHHRSTLNNIARLNDIENAQK